MFILPEQVALERVEALLRRYEPASRFTFRVERERSRYNAGKNGRPALRLRSVRLKAAKDYCGQHAGPCQAQFARPHRRERYLEGADWVALDDMINDVLDRHRIAADVWSKGREFSGPYYVRRGRCRRTRYGLRVERSGGRNFVLWTADEAEAGWSADHYGATRDAPRSEYPAGTPGIPEWRRSRARRWERLLAADPAVPGLAAGRHTG
jgi:hypothetical protein